jgi:outer membrane protein assembly factor BamB
MVDPAFRSLLPPPAPQSPVVAPSPSSTAVAGDPFRVVSYLSWATTGLATPLAIDVGPDGMLYVLDTKPSVSVIDPDDGDVIRAWGRQGVGDGEFDLTRSDDNPGFGDVFVAGDGRVFVADGTNRRVQVFAADGSYLSQFDVHGPPGSGAGPIEALAVADDGSVFVLDEGVGHLSRYGADGDLRWRSTRADVPTHAAGLAIRADGRVLVTSEGSAAVTVINPEDGRAIDHVPLPAIDGDGFGILELDPSGNLYIGVFGSGSQLVFDPDGALLGARGAGDRPPRIGRTIELGTAFWPAPVFMSDSRAFIFGAGGIVELEVRLPPA